MDILYLSHHVYFCRNKTECLKAGNKSLQLWADRQPTCHKLGIGKDKVCLDSAEEGLHLFGTICFKEVLLISPSSLSDFIFLLFAFYTIPVVHVFFKSKEINV